MVRKQEQVGNAAVIHAMVPLQSLFGYIGSLRALTSGRASYLKRGRIYLGSPFFVGTQYY